MMSIGCAVSVAAERTEPNVHNQLINNFIYDGVNVPRQSLIHLLPSFLSVFFERNKKQPMGCLLILLFCHFLFLLL